MFVTSRGCSSRIRDECDSVAEFVDFCDVLWRLFVPPLCFKNCLDSAPLHCFPESLRLERLLLIIL
jgi:hypothetical protein